MKKGMKQNLLFAIIWSVLGLLNLDYDGNNQWTDYGYLIMAILYWIVFFYDKRRQG